MMQSLTLAQRIDVLVEHQVLNDEIPDHITNNLAPSITLRPYQEEAINRWFYYMDEYSNRPSNPHLLFHMATGSGKTVLMATLILDLYRKGYRNFMFFVNSSQIIEKTKENFLNPSSTKYLFAPLLRIDDQLVDIRAVDVFDAANCDTINIHFTTIQGLHSKMQDPRENAITAEDFRDHKVVMISDEAHHLNVETINNLNQGEIELKKSWEGTANAIFGQNNENILLEFTATIDLEHPAIVEKYKNKILYDYSLQKFREDGYSKDIALRQADLLPLERMKQAIVLSQYRRKVSESQGLPCKPVVLMKSKKIDDSNNHEVMFKEMISELSGNDLEMLWATATQNGDDTLSQAFDFIMNERGIDPETFALELKGDFDPGKIANVNKPEDLAKRQIELNTLEDRANELRVIFAVDKLNEGWDVLNLFDIVRLYDTRDARENEVGKTTIAEAQLIGRGARYYPFIAADQPEADPHKRKYDSDVTHRLRILEQLHYHCSHNPRYIQEIQSALRKTGMLDENSRVVELRLKDRFKQSSLYLNGYVWANERIKNSHEDVVGLNFYKVDAHYTYPRLMTGLVTEISTFGYHLDRNDHTTVEPISRELKLNDFSRQILGFAMDANKFFHFASLRTYFPQLASSAEFLESKAYLGGVKVTVNGMPEDLDNLTARHKLDIARYVLHQIEGSVKRGNVEYVGTKDFSPHKISDCFTDKSLKLSAKGEAGRSWTQSQIPGLDRIDLASKDWHVYNDSYGTDQEKHFIKFLNDRTEQLHQRYDDFFLLRNEKAVKLYSFSDGRGFEPDFVLILRKRGETARRVLQLFIEPKGDYLKQKDSWKEAFLIDIEEVGKIELLFEGRNYAVYGLPFFNESEQGNTDFNEAFNRFLAID